jgi:protein O-mannosyl-transferase
MQEIKSSRNSIAVTLLFTVVGLVIYIPLLGNGFLSDDYDSLYRIYIQKRILYREFLRPMIDISFYFNFLISGLSAWSYYIFNIVVHIINALLLFRLASRYVLFSKKDQWLFAFWSALLFLIYPFHNESIAWLSGRLSSMACLFALISLIIASERKGKMASIMSAIFFLLGLLCYESIIFLPGIILIIQWLKERSVKNLFVQGGFWFLVACFYLLIRLLLSGEITGEYGSRLSDNHILQKFLNTGKVLGRLFLPGSENQRLLVIMTIVICFFILIITVFILRNKNQNRADRTKWIALMVFALISLLIPVAFGVSTRTSESDRLLYFPSCFICMLLIAVILQLFSNKTVRLLWFSGISIYFLCFLEINNMRWVKASRAAESILETVRNRGVKNIILINVPDELEGAFVFRNGLEKALEINKADTSEVKIMNYLKRSDYLKTGETIPVQILDSTQIIYPECKIVQHAGQYIQLTNTKNNSSESIRKDRNLMYYWNKEALIRLFRDSPDRK